MTSVQIYLGLGLLAVVAGLLAWQVWHQRYNYLVIKLERAADAALERLKSATNHHVEVAGAVAYLDRLRARPELIANLGEYSRQALAASLMQRLAIVGKTIEEVQSALRKNEAGLANHRPGYYSSVSEGCRKQLTQLQADQQNLQHLADQLSSALST